MELANILSAFGLSASAGLNAYIPLLMIALTARLFPEHLQLAKPYDLLATDWSIAILAVLLAIEVLADKVPAVDHVNDVIATVIRPTAGAILFASATSQGASQISGPLALVAGFIIAGAAHGAKATARPAVTLATGGVGNPVVSAVEDVTALVTSAVAILAPLLIGIAMLVFAALFAWWLTGRSRRDAAKKDATP